MLRPAPTPSHRAARAIALVAALVAGVLALAAPTSATTTQEATTSATITSLSAIESANGASCGIDDQADLYCWGDNDHGQLGTGDTTDQVLPTAVATAGTPLDGKDIADVALGSDSACALATDDTLACWGDDAEGQLGNGPAGDSLVPTAVSVASTPLDGADIVDLDMLHLHVCALTSTGAMACWGLGSVGQLGQGAQSDSDVPVGVATAGSDLDGKTVETIVAGAFNTCALATDDTVACWGTRSRGTIGDGGTGTYQLSPGSPLVTGTPLEGKDLTEITNSRYTTCVTATDGTISCWGAGDKGALGNGGTEDADTPVAVTTAGTPLAGKVVDQLTAGVEHICGRTTDGTVACWGDDLAVGIDSTDDSLVPVAPSFAGTSLDGTTVSQISAGWTRTCAVGANGQAACWGAGRLGDGANATSRTPVSVVLSFTAPVTAPTFTEVTPDEGGIYLAWEGPSDDGGVPPTKTRIRWYGAGAVLVGEEERTNFDPEGDGDYWVAVTPGIPYRFTVASGNDAGWGPESAPSAPVVALETGPDQAAYVPITPCRIVDTRQAGGRFGDREIRDFQVTGDGGGTGSGATTSAEDVFTLQGGKEGGCGIPTGVSAVEASITAVDPLDSGFFRAWPTGESMPNATFMNFDRGMDITNTGSVTIAVEEMEGAATSGGGVGELRARNFGGSSHYVIDIQGYFTETESNDGAPATTAAFAGESRYAAITPCRVLDTRQAGGTIADREIRDISVTDATRITTQGGKAGGCDIPLGTVAVEASVTAVSPADSGFFRAWPAGESMPNATFMNFDRGMDITNTGALTIAFDEPASSTTSAAGDDELRIRNFGGTSHYVIDIQGYYLGDGRGAAVGAETAAVERFDATYVAITPCRIVDTRQVSSPLTDRQIRDVTVIGDGAGFAAQGGKAGGCDIPENAIAVEASVTAVDPLDSGFFRAWPAGESMPNATFMNFDVGMDITNTGSLTIEPEEPQHLRIRNFGGTSHYVIDLQGYFVGPSMES